jgi:hypothetical protein
MSKIGLDVMITTTAQTTSIAITQNTKKVSVVRPNELITVAIPSAIYLSS